MHSVQLHCYILKQMQDIFLCSSVFNILCIFLLVRYNHIADAVEDWRDGVWWNVRKLQDKYFIN